MWKIHIFLVSKIEEDLTEMGKVTNGPAEAHRHWLLLFAQYQKEGAPNEMSKHHIYNRGSHFFHRAGSSANFLLQDDYKRQKKF